MDKTAYDADGVMLVNRVKWHTDFAGEDRKRPVQDDGDRPGQVRRCSAISHLRIQSRTGKSDPDRGPPVARVPAKSLAGSAILEDANHNTAQLTAVRVEEMEQKEEELLVTAKSWMGRIPFDLDILMLDEIGKTISGAGMDTKVVNRSVQGQYNPWDTAPKLERLFVRGDQRAQLWERSRIGNGRCDPRPAAGANRLESHTNQFVNGIDTGRDSYACPFPDGSDVSGEDRSHRRKAEDGRCDNRMDPQFAGTRARSL